MKQSVWLAILLAALLTSVGCGDGEDDFGNNFGNNTSNSSNSSNTSNNDDDGGGDADVGGSDVGPDADADAGFDTGDDGGSEIMEGTSCSAPTELGVLTAGEEHIVDASLLEPHENLDTSCDQEEVGDRAHVFSLEPEVTSRLSIWSTVSPSQYDLRQGECDDPEEVLTCTTAGSGGADLIEGESYHLVVWGDALQSSDFELRLDVEEAVCNPEEPDWCEDGVLYECRRTTNLESEPCIEDCADESSCRGNACDTAVEIDLSVDSEATAAGHLGAYGDTWNAADLTDGECAYEDRDTNPDTPNADTFFEVSGLTTGQTLTVESMQSGDYAFFVLDACGADTCLAAVDADEFGDQRMVWEVPSDGTYIVVAEPITRRERDFEFSFLVE